MRGVVCSPVFQEDTAPFPSPKSPKCYNRDYGKGRIGGLVRALGERVWPQGHRGFESRPFRQYLQDNYRTIWQPEVLDKTRSAVKLIFV